MCNSGAVERNEMGQLTDIRTFRGGMAPPLCVDVRQPVRLCVLFFLLSGIYSALLTFQEWLQKNVGHARKRAGAVYYARQPMSSWFQSVTPSLCVCCACGGVNVCMCGCLCVCVGTITTYVSS